MRSVPNLSVLSLCVLLAACGKPERVLEAQPLIPAPEASAPAKGSGPLFQAREGWVEENPSSPMRFAQFRLPGPAGDAEVAVFHFGVGAGGSVEENFERWTSQFAPDDPDAPVASIRTESQQGDVKLHGLELAGQYQAGMGPAMGGGTAVSGQRMLATILECEGGPYFVKLVGPDATVERWRTSYTEFLAAFRP